MTRKEAIEIINRENDPNDKEVWEIFPEYREALDMAIQALSQEPCETSTDEPMTMVYPTIFCDDAISREAAIEAVKQAIYNHDSAIMRLTELPSVNPQPCDDAISRDAVMRLIENKPYDWSNLTERHNMLMEIRKLPSVTQKSGHWIREVDFGNVPYYVCSECGVESVADTDFCFACGADMRGDTE